MAGGAAGGAAETAAGSSRRDRATDGDRWVSLQYSLPLASLGQTLKQLASDEGTAFLFGRQLEIKFIGGECRSLLGANGRGVCFCVNVHWRLRGAAEPAAVPAAEPAAANGRVVAGRAEAEEAAVGEVAGGGADTDATVQTEETDVPEKTMGMKAAGEAAEMRAAGEAAAGEAAETQPSAETAAGEALMEPAELRWLEDTLQQLGGTPHLGKLHSIPPGRASHLLPACLGRFQQAVRRMDPVGLFAPYQPLVDEL